MRIAGFLSAAAVALVIPSIGSATPLTFTQLPGLTGGALGPATPATGVWRSSLSSLGNVNILSITLKDNSSSLGGATGAFTGFDLDGIVLSTTNCADATCVQGLSGLPVFDFASGTLFTPGTQRPTTAPKLFGTGPAGNTVDNAVATLGLFDGISSTFTTNCSVQRPCAFGFISFGDNGAMTFNLLSPVSTAGLYLYIGEVGNNGEVAASSITVQTPEPATVALIGLGLAGLAASRRRKLR